MLTCDTDLNDLLTVRLTDPHRVLGMHPAEHGGQRGVVVRALLREVASCEVVDFTAQPEVRHPLARIAPEGLYEGFIPTGRGVFRYRLRVVQNNGEVRQFYDPYSFLPTLTDQDVYLFNEGNEHRAYEKLGSHRRVLDGVPGFSFAVWAPGAKRVSLVGDFNGWDGRYHPMRAIGASGIWELFVPGLEAGRKYKYELVGHDGHQRLKTDPYAVSYEGAPHHAALTWEPGRYFWNDAEWLEQRARTDWRKRPVSIYEVHAGSWRRVPEDGHRPLTYREMAQELVPYVKEQGFTHIEFLPLLEHPFTGSWGYQVTGFFAPTHRFGTPEDLMYLIDVCHQHGLGVILDWVPAHFPRDSFALAQFDGTHLYEHEDPRQGAHQDWGTLIFNYGRHEVRCFLLASALAWFERFHIDGLRVDAVASMLYLDYSRRDGEWVPNRYGGRENLEALDFLRQMNVLVHRYYPGAMTIAEESTSFPGITRTVEDGGVGFDFKWNMGWMHDSLLYFGKDPLYRRHHQQNLTFGMMYQYTEAFVQVFSHDEVVHMKGSMIGKMAASSMREKAGMLRALYALMWLWPGKKTLFMGSEFGQSAEWNAEGSLQWHLLQYLDHSGLQLLVRDLNRLYAGRPDLAAVEHDPLGFYWGSLADADSCVISFFRRGRTESGTLLVVGHYSGHVRRDYRVGVPFRGRWKEILNTAADVYGGSGLGNLGGAQTRDGRVNEFGHHLSLTLPPSTTLVFEWQADPVAG